MNQLGEKHARALNVREREMYLGGSLPSDLDFRSIGEKQVRVFVREKEKCLRDMRGRGSSFTVCFFFISGPVQTWRAVSWVPPISFTSIFWFSLSLSLSGTSDHVCLVLTITLGVRCKYYSPCAHIYSKGGRREEERNKGMGGLMVLC